MSRVGQYTSSIQSWPSGWQISQHFSKTRGKALKEVRTVINQVMLRAAATVLCGRGGRGLQHQRAQPEVLPGTQR